MSADCSTTWRLPRPRVALFHSVGRVALIFATAASRSGTSDGSGLNCARGGTSAVTRTLNEVGVIAPTSISNEPVAVPLMDPLVHVTLYVAMPFGTRGVGYVQRAMPCGSAVTSGRRPGGCSPTWPGATRRRPEQTAPPVVAAVSAPYVAAVTLTFSVSSAMPPGRLAGPALALSTGALVTVGVPEARQAVAMLIAVTAYKSRRGARDT